MKGLPVLGFGIVMYLCVLWFMRIIRIDAKHSDGYRTIPIEYAAFVIAISYPIVVVVLWIITYVPVNMLVGLPEWNLSLTATINNVLVLSIANIALALSLIYVFYQHNLLRMRAPRLLCSILLLGGFIYNLILIFQDHGFTLTSETINNASYHQSAPTWIKKAIHGLSNLSKVSIVTIFVLVKSYLGPLATGYILCSLLYSHFVSKNQVELSVFLLGPLLDWALEVVPHFWSSAYLILQVSYNVIENGFETLQDLDHN